MDDSSLLVSAVTVAVLAATVAGAEILGATGFAAFAACGGLAFASGCAGADRIPGDSCAAATATPSKNTKAVVGENMRIITPSPRGFCHLSRWRSVCKAAWGLRAPAQSGKRAGPKLSATLYG